MSDAREIIIERLREDLIGPYSGGDELLLNKPSDQYLTGIVYPKETRIPEEQQDDTEEVFEGKDDGQDATETGVSGFRKFKPCTAGMSFAVKCREKNPKIVLVINFGTYVEEPRFIPLDPVREDNPKIFPPNYWKRVPQNIEIPITLEKDITPVNFDGPSLEHIELYIRQKRLPDCSIITAQVINKFEPEPNT